MDYEKKYKEALEMAKVAALNGLQNLMEGIFPELAESEDEKTRKRIIALVNAHGQGVYKDDMLAWLGNIPYTIDHEKREGFHLGYKAALEKQGEHKSIDDLTQQEAMDIAVAKCFEQGEQKPADKVEPKFKVKYAGSEYNVFETKNIDGVTFYGIEDEPNHIDYVKADNCEIISVYGIKESGLSIPTKPVIFSEKKQKRMISAEAKEAMYDKPACAWSEEDECYMNECIKAIATKDGRSFEEKRKTKHWLKSLKQKIGE